MPTEWLRVMLDEVARKRREADAARIEARARELPAIRPAPPTVPRATAR
jgi:hypothetical protein